MRIILCVSMALVIGVLAATAIQASSRSHSYTTLAWCEYEPALHQKTAARKKRSKHRRKLKAVYVDWGTLSPEEVKQVQSALLEGRGNDHDDPARLADAGDISSVPALIAVLKRNPANPDGSAICTRWHCLVALSKLTKADVGYKTEDWEKWWDNYQKKK